MGFWDIRVAGFARVVGIASVLCVAIGVAPSRASAQQNLLDAPFELVLFGEDDTLRGLVEQHLGDPDLWPTVLRLNGIDSPADLVPGTQLRLPVQQVKAADMALTRSLDAIQKATSEGARIFAPVEIGQAAENREAAVGQREVGIWADVVNLSDRAAEFATEALNISIAQRDRSAEAVVSDVQGSVEGRAPAEPRWSDRDLNDVLVEFERLRTLSDSTTQVTFRDLSRLRLNPNSNATIQRMRSDPLTGGEVTKVSLVNGDFYALLNQLSDKTAFEIEVEGVETTTTNSSDFWIKNDSSGARFVNYDEPEIEIIRNGQAIIVGENEGIVLNGGGTERAQVLDSPRLLGPELGQILYDAQTQLNWDTFEGAEAYWLEVALDPGFNQMQVSEWGIRETGFTANDLPPSRYFWRVAALDRLGLPGQWSKSQDFTIRFDQTPPFLTLLQPGPGVILGVPRADILGATEPDSTLTLNGQPLEISGDGTFAAQLALAPGPNVIAVIATDPAGNESSRSETIVYRPVAAVEMTLSAGIPRVENALATRLAALSVFAETNAEPGARVLVKGADGAVVVETLIKANGRLAFTVPVDEAPRSYIIETLGPSGAVEGSKTFLAVRDQTPPEVAFDLPPPRATGDDIIDLAGRAPDAARLQINDRDVALQDGRFARTLELEPGQNAIKVVATDAVGNITVRQLKTLYDIDPPEIIDIQVGRPKGNSGPIEIIVQAQDESGLIQAAPFVLEVGDAEREGFLRCDSAAGLCRGTLPPEPGALSLIEVVVEDYAGNAAFN